MSPARTHFVDSEEEVIATLVFRCWKHELRGRAADAGAVRSALERWIRQGLRFQVREGKRYFDYFEVMNHLVEHGHAGKDPVLTGTFAPCLHWCFKELVAPDAGAAHFHSPRRFRVEWVREIDLGERAPGARVRFGIPLPVPEGAQQDLGIVVRQSPPDARTAVTPGLLDVRAMVPASGRTVSIGLGIEVTAYQTRFDETVTGFVPSPEELRSAGPENPEIFPGTANSALRITPRLRERIGTVSGAGRGDFSTLKAIWRSFFDRVKMGCVNMGDLDAAEPLVSVLDRGWADCKLASALLVAMCRLHEIPARMVFGIILQPFEAALHWWAEAYVEGSGWCPVDSLAWLISGGRFVEPLSARLLGKLDYRLVLERPPNQTLLGAGVRFPDFWTVSQALVDDAGRTDHRYKDAQTGVVFERDELLVSPVG